MSTSDLEPLRMARVLLWSARYDVENGQAIVTRRVVERQQGVEWIRCVYRPSGGLAMLRAGLAALSAMVAILWRRPDCVYAVCSRSVIGFVRDLPVLLTAWLGARVIVHVHGSDLPDLLAHRHVGALARALYRRCEVIVPSAHLVEPLAEAGCRAVILCENFMAETAAPITAPAYRGGAIRLLWNSNIMASKGICEAVAGAARARAEGYAVQLTVLGKPIGDAEAEAREMAAFAATLAEHEWIDHRGAVPADAARLAVAEHDAVLLPSRYASECQPLALIEAMAAGREIIIRDTPALRATAGNYPAILVGGDAGSIAGAIADLRAGAAERASRLMQAAQSARMRFSPERFDRIMAQIFLSKPPLASVGAWTDAISAIPGQDDRGGTGS